MNWDLVNAVYEHTTHAGFWLFILWQVLQSYTRRVRRLKIDRSGIEIDFRKDDDELDLTRLGKKP